jgi:hypothetical protein
LTTLARRQHWKNKPQEQEEVVICFPVPKMLKKKINKNQYDNASGLKKKGSSELKRLPTALDKCRQ